MTIFTGQGYTVSLVPDRLLYSDDQVLFKNSDNSYLVVDNLDNLIKDSELMSKIKNLDLEFEE